MKLNNIFVCLLIALFFACLVLAYKWIDRSISYSYLDQSYINERQAKNNLEKIIKSEWIGLDKEVVYSRLKKCSSENLLEPPIFDADDNNIIWFDGGIKFNFKENKLISVGDS